MICPKCKSQNIRVYDSFPSEDDYVFRRRKCKDCGEKFRTVELVMEGDSTLKYKFSDAIATRHYGNRGANKQ